MKRSNGSNIDRENASTSFFTLKQNIHSTLTESMRSDEYSNLGDFDFVFEINLGYESWDQVGSFGEKNRSPKSRDKYTCKMMHVVSNISIND
jgi:hypothetical protein